MTYPSEVQQHVDNWAKSQGFEKRNGSWYRKEAFALVVLELQKSQFGPAYFLNVGLSLSTGDAERYPKVQHCHVYGRVEDILSDDESEDVDPLFDLDVPFPYEQRGAQISGLLNSSVLPLLESLLDRDTLLQSAVGGRFLENALVDVEGQRLLAS